MQTAELMTTNLIVQNAYPSFIKYMGSKSKIMDFVLEGINEVYNGGPICDLFAGSGSLAGAIGQQCPVISNDIQSYSKVLANVYSKSFLIKNHPSADDILNEASAIVSKNKKQLGFRFDYSNIESIEEFNEIEDIQKSLIDRQFRREWHLFVKNYSGTWWNYEQCLWIDALRQIAERYKGTEFFDVIVSCLMFAMAYTSQGTGHYAQFRDAKTSTSLDDILIYRKRSLTSYFRRKYDEVINWLPKNKPILEHKTTALDYTDCLAQLDGGTVYADPPYCFVHYSRFYHAIETLVLYDYPELQVKGGKVVKGRYRENRHQSPFCIKTQVPTAFENLFKGVQKSGANLVMSYSNTGMISVEEVEEIATKVFKNRKKELLFTNHQHMTLGRLKDRHREVEECLLLVHS